MNSEEYTVQLPSKDDLLGDKLTAYAPNTTGIPYIKKITRKDGTVEERDCSMEIIKQLFDIASLFDKIDNLSTARDTFLKIAPIELEYRGMDKDNIQVILDDIYSTSLLICTGLYTKDTSEEYIRLTKGIRRIHDLIIIENYNHYSAIVNASKAAYLSVLIGKGINTIKRYDPTINLRDIQIGEPIPPAINKLKAIRPEAFFYWCEIEQLLTVQ